MIRKLSKAICALIVGLSVIVVGTQMILAQSNYVGSEVCKNCHDTEGWDYKYTKWKSTLHNKSLRDPDLSPGVVADSDFKNGLDLSTDPDFSKYGTNAPVLSYDASDPADSTDNTSGYRVTIGNITYTVHRTYGGNGSWKQRYQTKIGNSFYILPIQYNEKTGDWVTYDPDHWYDANNQPLYNNPATLEADIVKKNSFERRCAGCHNTGLKVFYDDVSGEYTSSYNELNIGCEKCHGPGGPPSHVNYGFGMTGGGLNPVDLGTNRANEVCGQCHSRGSSIGQMGPAKFGYPWATADSTGGFVAGDSLEAFYDFVDPVNDPKRFWPDGKTSKSHHQQFLDFYNSPKPTFAYHQVRCYECHDPHGSTNEHDIVESIEDNGLVIATENDNNTLCLACHATHEPFEALTKEMIANYEANLDTIATVVSAHTGHSYDPENKNETGGASRCSKCHMPKVAKSAIAYDIHSHTFEAISPQKTLDYQAQGGMPNSCAVSCHRNPKYANIPSFGITDATLTDWTENSDIRLAQILSGTLPTAQYVGSETCAGCHNTIADSWRQTLHHVMLQDTSGILTQQASGVSVFDPSASGYSTYVEGVFPSTPPINDVLYTIGSSWKQRYLKDMGGNEYAILPAQWLVATQTWGAYHAAEWNDPARRWGKKCAGCHTTGYTPSAVNSPAGTFNEMGVGCESCHGPGSSHVNSRSKADIVNPDSLAVDRRNEVCGQCHFRGSSSGGYYGFAWNEADTSRFLPGEVLADHITEAPGRWPDGETSKKHHQQWQDWKQSEHADNPYHIVGCSSCHDPHGSQYDHNLVADNDDNSLCLSCHAPYPPVAPGDSTGVMAHTRHSYDPTGKGTSRCTKCHMAKVAKSAVNYDIHAHTFEPIPPQFTLAYNMPNSCAVSCHRKTDYPNFGIDMSADNIGDWSEATDVALADTLMHYYGPYGVWWIVTEVEQRPIAGALPTKYSLDQNYPNPFNPKTTITFDLVRKGKVTLKVFNLLGQEVATLVDKELLPGSHKVIFDGAALASGIYFYKLSTNGFTSTKKMLLLK